MVLDAKVGGWEPLPYVDSDVAPWRLGDDLLELTPRDIWGFIKSHPNFNDVDLKTFYQSLVDKSFCSGFGPVIAPKDVESALIKVYPLI